MATKHFSGVVTPKKVRSFLSGIAHEMWFYSDDQIKGKATINDSYTNCIFQVGDLELTIKMKTITNPIEL